MQMKKIQLNSSSIFLPNYMLVLHQEQIDKLINAGSLHEKIIAAGVSKDKKVSFLSADCVVHIFDPSKYHIPFGAYVPLESGEEIFLPNQRNRWPIQIEGFKVKSKWLLQESEHDLHRASLEVANNYLGDFEFSPITPIDT
jgi:hypothetical protein